MVAVEDYVARIDGVCGKEKDVIVIFKYGKKDDAIKKILEKAKVEKSISQIIFELTFGKTSFRLYKSGKAIFRGLRNENELKKVLSALLS